MTPLSASRPGQVFQSLWVWINSVSIYSGWWFGTCFIFPYIGNSNPNRRIFFRGMKPPTSIQARIFYSSWPPCVTNVAFGNPCVSLGKSSGMEESFHIYVTLFTWVYPQCFHLRTIEKSMRKSTRSWDWSGTHLDLLVVIHWLVCCRVVPRSTFFFSTCQVWVSVGMAGPQRRCQNICLEMPRWGSLEVQYSLKFFEYIYIYNMIQYSII